MPEGQKKRCCACRLAAGAGNLPVPTRISPQDRTPAAVFPGAGAIAQTRMPRKIVCRYGKLRVPPPGTRPAAGVLPVPDTRWRATEHPKGSASHSLHQSAGQPLRVKRLEGPARHLYYAVVTIIYSRKEPPYRPAPGWCVILVHLAMPASRRVFTGGVWCVSGFCCPHDVISYRRVGSSGTLRVRQTAVGWYRYV